MSANVVQETKSEGGGDENADPSEDEMQGQVVHVLEANSCCGGENTRAYITVLVLFVINLLNYMDRQTIAGRRN